MDGGRHWNWQAALNMGWLYVIFTLCGLHMPVMCGDEFAKCIWQHIDPIVKSVRILCGGGAV